MSGSESNTPVTALPLTRDEQLRAVFEHAGVGMALTAPDGHFVEVNHRFCEILGYSATALHDLTFLGVTHPDDVAATRDCMQKLIDGRIPNYKLEKRYVCANGQYVWCNVSVTALRREDGGFSQFIGVIEDITQRKQAERARDHLAAVVEYSDDAIVTKTLDGMITTWNPGAERIFGYSAREAIGRPIMMLVPSEYAGEELAILAHIRRGEPVSHCETLRRRKDGSLVNVSLSVSPLKDSSGQIVGASKIARDITLQKSVEAALKAQTDMLRDMDRRKDEFLATLSHELRNPLAPIRQAAVIAATEDLSPERRRWATDMIRRQVLNMSLLLDDLLDVARITRGTLQLRTDTTELATVIAAAVETARPLLDAKRHRFENELPSEPTAFVADPLRLAQVLSNLLTNAAKYTDEGGSIRLVAHASTDQVVIRVQDNGIGIPAEALPRIFTMFSQAPEARNRSEGGLGIGLALAKGLVELHSGTIEAQSAGLGRGSTFIVTLPRRAARVQAAAPEAPSLLRVARKRRVVVADDNRDAADSLGMLLSMDGHDVTVVYDGARAVQAIVETSPDVALLDIGMPEMNGYEVARAVRKDFPKESLTLVAVTGWGQHADIARAAEAGFDRHFTKPIDPEDLAALVTAGDATR